MTKDEPRRGTHRQVIATLLAFSAAQNELARLFARSRGMHMTDATAIVQIIEAEERGEPLTPARLGERIALTSGATSILLNRLEENGHIRRTRENTDRRVVTLHASAEIEASADAFYEPLARQLRDVLEDYPSSALDLIKVVVGRLNATMDSYMATIDPTAG